MVILYGIKNCDKIRAARRWLDDLKVSYHFHDYRVDGMPDCATAWFAQYGWGALINRRSTSWRSLDDTQRQALDAQRALELATQLPTLIKRPLLSANDQLLIGFDADAWTQTLTHETGASTD